MKFWGSSKSGGLRFVTNLFFKIGKFQMSFVFELYLFCIEVCFMLFDLYACFDIYVCYNVFLFVLMLSNLF